MACFLSLCLCEHIEIFYTVSVRDDKMCLENINEPADNILVLITSANSECTGEPAHRRFFHKSLLCSHVHRMDMNTDSGQN